MALGRRAGEELDARLRDLGLTYRHLSALGHLNREPHMSYSDLGRRVGVTAQSMQATMRHLEDRGAVAAAGRGGRGRSAELVVTDNGRALLATGMKAVSDTENHLLQRLSAPERNVLRKRLFELMAESNAGSRGDEYPPEAGNDDT